MSCGFILADKDWILSQVLRNKVKSMTSFLHVKSIGTAIHLSKNFIHIPFYFFGTNNNSKSVLAEIKQEVHLVEKLKIEMLVGNDILVLKRFILDLSNKETTISSCNTKIKILMKFRGQFISKKILAIKNFVIPP